MTKPIDFSSHDLSNKTAAHPASRAQYLIAMTCFLVYACANARDAVNALQAIGLILGSLIFPLLMVLIASFWPKQRHAKARVNIFTITVLFLLMYKSLSLLMVNV